MRVVSGNPFVAVFSRYFNYLIIAIGCSEKVCDFKAGKYLKCLRMFNSTFPLYQTIFAAGFAFRTLHSRWNSWFSFISIFELCRWSRISTDDGGAEKSEM